MTSRRRNRKRKPLGQDPSRANAIQNGLQRPEERSWNASRSGGWAGRGFHFQDAVGAWFAAMIAHGSTLAGELVPEGLEDVSLESDARLHIQVKSRSEHLGFFPATKAADHILDTFEKSEDRDAPADRSGVFFENGIAGTRPFGLTMQPLARCLTREDSFLDVMTERAANRGYSDRRVEQLLDRTCVLDGSWTDLLESTIAQISAIFPLAPSACRYVASELRREVADAADKNASSGFGERTRLSRSRLLKLISDFVEHLDVDSIEAAIRSGACEFLDFAIEAPEDDRFYEGVAAQPYHVRQGLVVSRPDIAAEASRALAEGRAVVLTGPSGVGKSALLWTIPLAHGPCTWFRVKRLSRADVPDLVRLARTYGASPSRPVGFLVDAAGSGTFSGWPELREAVSSMPGVLLVATARSEDLAALGDLAGSAAIPVALDERAAEAIFEGLKKRDVCDLDHWQEPYLATRGLTMEYTHLLTRGRRLADLIDDQVSARIAADRFDELKILAVVSVADRWSALTSTPALAAECGFAPMAIRKPLRRLVDEHLLVERDGRVVGLHQLRSTAICEALHRSPPPQLATSVASVLRCADPATIVRFTANLLRDEPGQLATIHSALPTLWSSTERVAGVLRGIQLYDFSRLAREWVEIAGRHNVPVSSRPILMQFAAAGLTFPDFFPEPIRAAHVEMLALPAPNSSGEVATFVGVDRLMSLVLDSDRPTDAARLLAAIGSSKLDLVDHLARAELQGSPLLTALQAASLNEFGEVMTMANIVSTDFARRLLAEVGGETFVFEGLRASHPWITETEIREIDGTKTGWARFIQHSDDKQGDARSTVLSIARLLIRCLPDIETVDVQAVFPGGQPYQVGQYSPGVSGMKRSADHTELAVAWNRERLHATQSMLGSADSSRLSEALPLLEETVSLTHAIATAFVTGRAPQDDAALGSRLVALHEAAIQLQPPLTGHRLGINVASAEDKETTTADPLSGLITDLTGNAFQRLGDRSTHAALNVYLHDHVLAKSLAECMSEPWGLIGLEGPPESLRALRAILTQLGSVVSESSRDEADLAAIGRAARAGSRERALGRAAAAAAKAASRRHRKHVDDLNKAFRQHSISAAVVPSADPAPSGLIDIIIRLDVDCLLDWFEPLGIVTGVLADVRQLSDRFVIVPFREGYPVHQLAISMIETPLPATDLEEFAAILGEPRSFALADVIQTAAGALSTLSAINLLPDGAQQHESIQRLVDESQHELDRSIAALPDFGSDEFIADVVGMLSGFAQQLMDECDQVSTQRPLAEQITIGALNGLNTEASQQLAAANLGAIEWEIDRGQLLNRLYS